MQLPIPHDPTPVEQVAADPDDTVTWGGSGDDSRLFPPGQAGTDSSPVQFGDYELVGELARGGMGVVYRARQVSLNRPVALKMIRDGTFAGAEEYQRFRTEAEAAARLDHPGIVPVFEVGEQAGHPFFSMGLVEGETLESHLSRQRLSPRDAAMMLSRIVDAMAYAHARGVIHRDLKPANILIDSGGRPRVTDFGLAKKLESGDGPTVDGQILGTPHYMAPEQAAGQVDVGPPADIHAMGAILYRMLTDRPPFTGANVVEVLVDVRESEPRSPHELDTGIPRDLAAIAMKCLAKAPAWRYPSLAALGEDIDRFLRGEPTLARPAGRTARIVKWIRRRPTTAALIGVTVLAALALIVGGTWFQGRLQRVGGDLVVAESQAQQHAAEVDNARHQATRRRALEHFEQGRQLCGEGQIGEGLLWFVRCLEELPADETALEEGVRQELALWSERVSSPMWRVFHREGSRGPMFGSQHVGFSAERNEIVSCQRGVVRFHDISTGKVRHVPFRESAGKEPVVAALSPDGSWLATVGPNAPIEIWQAHTGGSHGLRIPHGLKSELPLLKFLPGGQHLIAAGDRIRVWDLETEKMLREFALPPAAKRGEEWRVLDIDPVTMRLIAATEEGKVQLWDPLRSEPIGPFLSIGQRLGQAKLSPDGKKYLLGIGGAVQIHDSRTGQQLLSISPGEGESKSVMFSPDGKFLLTRSNLEFRIWDCETGAPLGRKRFRSVIASCGFVPGHDDLLFLRCGGSAECWRMPAPAQKRRLPHARQLAASDGGKFLATLSPAGVVQVHSMGTWEPEGVPLQIPAGTDRVAVSPDGTLLLSSEDSAVRDDGMTQLWDRVSGEALTTLSGGHQARFTRSGRHVVTAGWRTVWKWAARSGHLIEEFAPPEESARPLAISRDGERVAYSMASRGVVLWDLRQNRQIGNVLPAAGVSRAYLSSDGSWLASRDGDDVVRLWNFHESETGFHPILPPDRKLVTSITFSDDARLMATFDYAGSLQLWHVASGLPLGPGMKLGYQNPLSAAALIVPDGTAAVTSEGTVWPIPVPAAEPLDILRIRAEVQSNLTLVDGEHPRPLELEEWQARRAAIESPGAHLPLVAGRNPDSPVGTGPRLPDHSAQSGVPANNIRGSGNSPKLPGPKTEASPGGSRDNATSGVRTRPLLPARQYFRDRPELVARWSDKRPELDGIVALDEPWTAAAAVGSIHGDNVEIRAVHDRTDLYLLLRWREVDDSRGFQPHIFFEDGGESPKGVLDGIHDDCRYIGASGSAHGFRDAYWRPGWSVEKSRSGEVAGQYFQTLWTVEFRIPLNTGEREDISVTGDETLGFRAVIPDRDNPRPAGITWPADSRPLAAVTWGHLKIVTRSRTEEVPETPLITQQPETLPTRPLPSAAPASPGTIPLRPDAPPIKTSHTSSSRPVRPPVLPSGKPDRRPSRRPSRPPVIPAGKSPELIVRHVSTRPTIDGVAGDEEPWKGDGEIRKGDGRRMLVQAVHDGTDLFLMLRWPEPDDTLGFRPHIYFEDDGDAADGVLDGLHEDCRYVGHTGTARAFCDAHWGPGWKVERSRSGEVEGKFSEGHWTVEFRIPLNTGEREDIHVTGAETLGFAAVVRDFPRKLHFAWPQRANPYKAETWGRLKFPDWKADAEESR